MADQGLRETDLEAYTDFSALYDEFMEDTPYDEWCERICKELAGYGITDGLVCELGAGTGEMTRRLKDRGFDMIGIDNSESMLMMAKAKDDSEDILYLNQDMRDMELYGTVRAIVSVCDSINYILDTGELAGVFKLCNNYLDPDGILIFDFNTEYKYRCEIGDTVISDVTDDAAFIWDNRYDDETHLNEYDITFFKEEHDGLYRRFTETHVQRGYTLEEIKNAIGSSGMVFLKAFDADTGKKCGDTSGRIVVVARECGKARH